ncbi:MAG: O-methyltransferase [Acidobacteriota bacterium]
MGDPQTRSGGIHHTAEILDFVNDLHAPHDPVLLEAFNAPGLHEMPAIQVGPADGKLMHLLLRIAGAARVVEIGTLAGYSTIWLARALPADGHLWSLEASSKHRAVAVENLRRAGLENRVTVLEGRAMSLLPKLEAEGPFDAVFIDADKAGYPDYGRWASKNLKKGGLLLADNAFFFGGLLAQTSEAEAMRAFHREAAAHFDTVCITNPDGLLLGVKR